LKKPANADTIAQRDTWFSKNHNPVKSRGKLISAGLALVLSFSICGSSPIAFADDLDNQKETLQSEANEMHESLEFIDTGIAKSAADLASYQGRLPAAQTALLEAQGRVSSATKEVETLQARVAIANDTKASITKQMDDDKAKVVESKKIVGQIASQAYKNGGVPSDITLMLGSENPGDITRNMDLADYAMRSQTKAIDKLNQQNATNENSKARLVAVEAEITDLKKKADDALSRENAARDEASSKKAELDKLVSDTARLTKELEASKPLIQTKLAQVESAQATLASQIEERDRRLREEWLAEEKRKAEAAAQAAAQQAAAEAAAARARNDAAAAAEAEARAREAEQNAAKPYVPPAPGPVSSFGLRHPFNGIPITSGFGWRATPPGTIDFYGQGGYMHTGIDFGAACGTPVYAAASGTITAAGWDPYGGGNHVRISHGVVAGNSLTTIYYHNTSVTVSNGQHVNQGDLIAYSGTTGNSTGCHSHFETWVNGQAVDPMNLL
jgi:murein DD-endopeptidase MepM/ murein hydrolase activator NlpD